MPRQESFLMRKVHFILLVLSISTVFVIFIFTGCLPSITTLSNSNHEAPRLSYSNDDIIASVELEKGGKTVLVSITNNSDDIIELVWPKASWNGNLLIDESNYRMPDAQPAPSSPLSSGATTRKYLTLKNSALFVDGKFYKLMPWTGSVETGDFVFAYAIDGAEHMFSL